MARAAEVWHLPIKARRGCARRGARRSGGCAESTCAGFGCACADAAAQAAPEEKKEKTPPNKDDVEAVLRDLKIKMPG